jgi:hypothetical protein
MKLQKTLFTILIALLWMSTTNAQLQLQPSIGKVFHTKGSGLTATRYSLAINNVFYDRIGFYYSYENRGAIMPFDNNTYTEDQSYKKDLLGVNVKIIPSLTFYGAMGAFENGIFSNQFNSKGSGIPWIVKPVGLRKEIGLQYNHINTGMSVSIGYSFSIGFTGNIGFQIPLHKNYMTIHQAIIDDPRNF